RTSRKALNVRLRTVIRGLRSRRLVISRIPIGLSVTANATINPAIAKSAIRGGEGSIGRSIDFSDNARGPGKAAHAKKRRSLQRHPHCVDVRRRQASVERQYQAPRGKTQEPRDEKGRFLPGNSGFGGRPLGSRNKFSQQFIDDVYQVWRQEGIETLRN